MPRYYFDVWDGSRLRCDRRGITLDSLTDAVSDAREIIRHSEPTSLDLSQHVVFVRDAAGTTVVVPMVPASGREWPLNA